MKEWKAAEKETQKMTRDGAISVNMVTGEASHVSDRAPEQDYSPSGDSTALARTVLHRVVEVKTEKRLARLQKNLSGDHPAIRRMYCRWGFAEDQGVTCYDILEAKLRRAHLTPYDPDGSEADYD